MVVAAVDVVAIVTISLTAARFLGDRSQDRVVSVSVGFADAFKEKRVGGPFKLLNVLYIPYFFSIFELQLTGLGINFACLV